ncbi:glycoside hydrolase family 78 protein [Streptomyces iconiensis]|uniref:alpha-L-rhamnosidase n=1 Tax=Streptomyces iconiensis TaxID=1384038 RepID=A0ABT7A4Q1_9ACTN|nr:glycoside hydrolase family 78 protein [Streptomyces iconiensis]MDJ1136300.1 glycoside hydrolase family 78 protein [Streptomyces iconiensis]
MISRRHLLATATATAAASGITAQTHLAQARPSGAAGRGSGLRVLSTTTEYTDRPLGLDTERPRLSWVLGSDARSQKQAAYRIRVATAPDRLGSPDVWDSGRRTSRQSVLVPYGGPALKPRTRYHWSVRVWGEDGSASGWSRPTWWETGTGGEDQWHAGWVTAPAKLVDPPPLEGAAWVWFPEGGDPGQAPRGTRWFRGTFEAPDGVGGARLVLTADDGFTLYVNGAEVTGREAVGTQKSWAHPARADVTEHLRTGRNVLAVAATNADAGAAGLLAALEMTADGATTRFVTGADGWRATDEEPSDGAWREPGYDDGGWQPARKIADWGAGPWGRVTAQQSPALLRRSFRLPRKPVAHARLYATALGLYETRLNGAKVGEDLLTPGWTDYGKRVAYQVYDVTGAVRGGENALAVTLTPGWYAGNIAWFGQRLYGEHPAMRAQLEVTYKDGSSERIGTDGSWRAETGPLLTADLMMGEEYDARQEKAGWDSPGFDDGGWHPVTQLPGKAPEVVAMTDAPTRVMKELTPVGVREVRPGAFLFDLGQNMVGTVRLKVAGKAGTRVTLRHGEVLDKDGSLYTANLRTARPVDTYTLKGGARETYEPRFTFHGFRYVEVTGYPGKPQRGAVTGLVAHTSAPFTMDFSTDSEMLNQLHSNITWGQRGNFLSIPTDTPARDERLGWSGDINVFAPTAAYVMESARFLTKWLQDLRDGQGTEGDQKGAYPDVAPFVEGVGKGVAGWGDAGVTVPWALYEAYGDVRVLEENWEAMRAWIAYLEQHSDGLLRPAEGYGDWLNIEDETPKDVIGTACFAHVTDLVARTAKLLEEESGPYEELAARIRSAFNSAYVNGEGRIKGDTQTAYVLALSMDLLPSAALRRAAADRLVALVKAKGEHLSTGFLGTPRLLPALTEAGHTDVAHALLRQRTFPSWGYQIDKGATTMWERWDSIRPDGSFQDVGMNSFNHYAYGSVGRWMYENLAGIAPGEPGFRKIVVRPRPGGGVNHAAGKFASPYGTVSTRWTRTGDGGGAGGFRLDVTVPVNATAEVWVPAERASQVRQKGAEFVRMEDGCAVFSTGSGSWRFEVGSR